MDVIAGEQARVAEIISRCVWLSKTTAHVTARTDAVGLDVSSV